MPGLWSMSPDELLCSYFLDFTYLNLAEENTLLVQNDEAKKIIQDILWQYKYKFCNQSK